MACLTSSLWLPQGLAEHIPGQSTRRQSNSYA